MLEFIGAGAGVGGLCTALTFWMRLQGQITEAKAEATEAKKDASDANVRAITVDKVLAMFKEQVARDYVSHGMLDKTETRLIAAIEMNIKPLTEAVGRLTERFDNYRDRAS